MTSQISLSEIKKISFSDSLVCSFEISRDEKIFRAVCDHGYIGDTDVDGLGIEIIGYDYVEIVQSSGEGWNPRRIEDLTHNDYLEDICEFIVLDGIVKVHGFSNNGWTQFLFSGGNVRAFIAD